MGKAGRLGAALAVAAVAVGSWAAATAGGQSGFPPELTCAVSGPLDNEVTFTVDTGVDTVRLERTGDEIRFSEVALVLIKRKGKLRTREVLEPVTCPSTPTVHNTDGVQIRLVGDESTDVEVSLRGGELAPGATPEPDGTPEVELAIREGEFTGLVSFLDGNGPSWFRFGGLPGGVNGINLNAQDEPASPDVDATLSPFQAADPRDQPTPDERAGAAEMGGGADQVTASGGPEFSGIMDAALFASGQSGDDTIIAAAPRFTMIFGGTGNDVISGDPSKRGRNIINAGPGDDLVTGGDGPDDVELGPGRDRAFLRAGTDIVSSRDGSRDRVHCGGHRDGISRDRKDRLRGCEFRTFRRIKISPPD